MRHLLWIFIICIFFNFGPAFAQSANDILRQLPSPEVEYKLNRHVLSPLQLKTPVNINKIMLKKETATQTAAVKAQEPTIRQSEANTEIKAQVKKEIKTTTKPKQSNPDSPISKLINSLLNTKIASATKSEIKDEIIKEKPIEKDAVIAELKSEPQKEIKTESKQELEPKEESRADFKKELESKQELEPKEESKAESKQEIKTNASEDTNSDENSSIDDLEEIEEFDELDENVEEEIVEAPTLSELEISKLISDSSTQIMSEFKKKKPSFSNIKSLGEQIVKHEKSNAIGNYALAYYYYHAKKPNLPRAKKAISLALKDKNPPEGASSLSFKITLKSYQNLILILGAGLFLVIALILKKKKAQSLIAKPTELAEGSDEIQN